jgi:hypothetical protein
MNRSAWSLFTTPRSSHPSTDGLLLLPTHSCARRQETNNFLQFLGKVCRQSFIHRRSEINGSTPIPKNSSVNNYQRLKAIFPAKHIDRAGQSEDELSQHYLCTFKLLCIIFDIADRVGLSDNFPESNLICSLHSTYLDLCKGWRNSWPSTARETLNFASVILYFFSRSSILATGRKLQQ